MNEKLIDLELLEYYDGKIKNFINTNFGIEILNSKNDLPQQGKENVIYIIGDEINIWDKVNSNYIIFTSNKSIDLEWGSF